MKNAILTVSFGTSYAEAMRTCIRPIEAALQAAYPQYDVYGAFTSSAIIRKLRIMGIAVESEEAALSRLESEGYAKIVVAPTNIIPGSEYEKVRAAARGHALSAPLLADGADLDWMAGVLGAIATEEKRPLMLMGHGADHAADGIYSCLRARLPENVFLACLKGEYTLDKLLPRLEKIPERNITLMPLMLATGAHAHINLDGNGGDSWKSVLKARGFDVRVRMQGLGQLKPVQMRFVEKVGRAISLAS